MTLAETHFYPLHEGAVKYLKELGKWTSAHEARRQQNIDLMTQWETAYKAAIAEADEKGVKIDPANEEWLDIWTSHNSGLTRFKMFQGLD